MKSLTVSKAFSLVELMVVVAIIALLAAVAIPSYKEYNNRAKMAEVNNQIGRQLDVWSEKNTLGQGVTSTVATALGKPVGLQDVFFTYGTTPSVVFTLTSALPFIPTGDSPLTLTYTPTVTNNVVSWTCSYPTASVDLSAYLLPNCTAS